MPSVDDVWRLACSFPPIGIIRIRQRLCREVPICLRTLHIGNFPDNHLGHIR